jgi:hypothetical protein
MLRKFGASALSRAELRAHDLLEDGNPVGRDIWFNQRPGGLTTTSHCR